MKESLFNVYKEVGKEMLVYNTFTKSFVRLDKGSWEDIQNAKDSLDTDHELVKHGFFLEDPQTQLDCYRLGYLQQCFSNKMLALAIAPTMECNLACSYCFEKGNKKPGLMTPEIEDKIVQFVSSQNPKTLSITWFGGEPLLGFPRILSLSRKFMDTGIPFTSSLITNGTLFNDYVIENLHYLNLKRIQISMDGCERDQDARRCFKNGAPTFNIVIGNIRKLLAGCDVRVGVQVTVDHNNLNASEELDDYIAKTFPQYYADRRIAVSKNFVKDRTGMGKDSGCFSNEDLINNDIQLLKNGRPDSISLPDTSLPCMHKTMSSYAIDAEGYLYKCLEHLGAPEEAVGSLAEGRLSISKLAEKMLGNDFLRSEDCLSCNILPLCGGGCPVDRCKVAKGLAKDSCSIYKSRFADLLPHYYNRKYQKKSER